MADKSTSDYSSLKNSNKINDDRFFQSVTVEDGRQGWFYTAREGTFGPFSTRSEAVADFRRRMNTDNSQRYERYRRLGLTLSRLWS